MIHMPLSPMLHSCLYRSSPVPILLKINCPHLTYIFRHYKESPNKARIKILRVLMQAWAPSDQIRLSNYTVQYSIMSRIVDSGSRLSGIKPRTLSGPIITQLLLLALKTLGLRAIHCPPSVPKA